jgi:hypothetical protein
MPKKRTSLDELSLSDTPQPEQVPKKTVTPGKPRIIKQTLYLPEVVHEQLRILAFHEKVKQHDLLIEGLNMMFKSRGAKSIAELTDIEV